MKLLTLISTLAILSSCSSSKNENLKTAATCPIDNNPPTKVWETKGFMGPESVVYDSKTRSYFVSNVTGGPVDKDGTGFISKLNSKGNIKKLKWIKGKSVHAPKGMRIRNGQLWYSDIDKLVSVNISRRKITNSITVPGAKFLNDVDYSKTNSSIYVTDMFTNKIHAIQKSPNEKVYINRSDLEFPNGVVVRNGEVVIASWGPGLDTTNFKTEMHGKLLSINEKTKAISNWTDLRIGNLDGVEFLDDDTIITSDWMAGKVYKVTKAGKCTTLLSGFKGSADLTYISSKKLLVIPLMLENKVVAYKLK
jgi:hypothetical protein